MKKLLLIFFILFTSSQASQLSYSFKKAKTKIEQQNLDLVKSSKRIKELKAFINDTFILKDEIKVIFGTKDGPYFDSKDNLIAIPYSFFQETKEKFRHAKYDKKENISLETATIDVLIHTILHELGHALVFMYEIPILAKEEDAVDNLANILLIDYFKDGDDILLTNADIYDLYDRERKNLDEYDFMDEHSLDLQRFYSMICFVYASNAEKYEDMLNDYAFPMYRKDMCIDELNTISSSWYKVLKNYMRD